MPELCLEGLLESFGPIGNCRREKANGALRIQKEIFYSNSILIPVYISIPIPVLNSGPDLRPVVVSMLINEYLLSIMLVSSCWIMYCLS